MTPEKNREIAEWCGWRWWCTTEAYQNDERCLYAPRHSPGPPEMFRLCEGADLDLPVKQSNALPKYDHSLDACAEFEAVVGKGIKADWYDYVVALRRVLGRDKGYDWCLSLSPQTIEPLKMLDVLHIVWLAMRATPAQRVEAILKVIREAKE